MSLPDEPPGTDPSFEPHLVGNLASESDEPLAGQILVIVGTGTDVGKTHVTCALAAALLRRGVDVAAWKPVASGVPDGMESPDTMALREALGGDASRVAPPLYSFAEPLSPHLAARRAGASISLDAIVARARELARGRDVLLVETAGGLFSPLRFKGRASMNSIFEGLVDNQTLVRALRATTILVAPDRIGVLHDVTATIRAGWAEDYDLTRVIALSAPSTPDASTGLNAREIEELMAVMSVVPFPRAAVDDPASDQAAAAVLAMLGVGMK